MPIARNVVDEKKTQIDGVEINSVQMDLQGERIVQPVLILRKARDRLSRQP